MEDPNIAYSRVMKDISSKYRSELQYADKMIPEAERLKIFTDSIRYGMRVLMVCGYFMFSIFFYTMNAKTCRDRSLNVSGIVCEDRYWSFLEATYFAIVTMFHVGYNDLTPKSDTMKIATIAFIVVGFYILTSFVLVSFIHLLFKLMCIISE